MKTLLKFLLVLLPFIAHTQEYTIEYTYQPYDDSIKFVNFNNIEYTIEYTYQPYHNSLSFDVILNNYIRDYDVDLYDLQIKLSEISSISEGYPINFDKVHIIAFINGSATPLPTSTRNIRKYIKDQYGNL